MGLPSGSDGKESACQCWRCGFHPWVKKNSWANNEKTEREIKETIPFTIATKRIKYLEVYLPKEMKDLYIENY